MKWYGLLAGLTVASIVMGYMVAKEGVYFLGSDNQISWQIDQREKREVLRNNPDRSKKLIVVMLKSKDESGDELMMRSMEGEVVYQGGWQKRWWGDVLTVNIVEQEYEKISHTTAEILMQYAVWGELEERMRLHDNSGIDEVDMSWIKLKRKR